jgi:LysM repeat protein
VKGEFLASSMLNTVEKVMKNPQLLELTVPSVDYSVNANSVGNSNDSLNVQEISTGGAIEGLPVVKKALPPKPVVKAKTYKVKSGDTLSQIAEKHHTSVAKIKNLNGLRSDMIRVGQILKIP